MTAPQPDGQLAQVLIKLGEMSIQLAHMEEQLKAVSDHEARIRRLEEARAKIYAVSAFLAALFGGGGTWLAAIINHR